MDLVANYANLCEEFNPDEPLESLYARLNECINYVTAAGKPIKKWQVVKIAYSLVAEMGQSQ